MVGIKIVIWEGNSFRKGRTIGSLVSKNNEKIVKGNSFIKGMDTRFGLYQKIQKSYFLGEFF